MRNEFLHQLRVINILLTTDNKFFISSYNVILGFVLMFSISNGFSQELKEKSSFLEKSVFLKSFNIDSSKSMGEYKHLNNLLNEINQTVFLTNSHIKTYGEQPVCMITDVQSLSLISSQELLFGNVELVTINISNPSDLALPIDLSSVCVLRNLKYIYIKLNFDIKSEKLIRFIKNCNPKCVIFYSVQRIS